MEKEEFYDFIKELGIEINKDQEEKLHQFYQILKEENKKMNLTRIVDQKDVYLKHFYDSLTIVKVIDLTKQKTLCDVGSGAGFPGIVLKIIYPNLKVTLIDSLNKRVNYLKRVIDKLQLTEIEALHIRGEDYENKFDVVTARAVANIEKLVTYTMHLVKKEGVFIAMKGDISLELTDEIKQKLSKKYQIIKMEQFLLPKENSHRSLIVMKNK